MAWWHYARRLVPAPDLPPAPSGVELHYSNGVRVSIEPRMDYVGVDDHERHYFLARLTERQYLDVVWGLAMVHVETIPPETSLGIGMQGAS